MKKMLLFLIAWGHVNFAVESSDSIKEDFEQGKKNRRIQRNLLISEIAKKSDFAELFPQKKVIDFLMMLNREEDKRIKRIEKKLFSPSSDLLADYFFSMNESVNARENNASR